MAILKAYFDDSGNENRLQEKACSLAGYVATVEQWGYFEEHWKKVLKEKKVSYLHMRDFAPCVKEFAKYKDDEQGRIELIQSLIEVMKNAQLEGVASVVKMPDIRYYNDRDNYDFIPYSLNLHTCMDIMSARWPNTTIELYLDRRNKLQPKINKAIEYAKSENLFGKYNKDILPIPLPKELNFRNFVEIQAADLLAWEIHKDVVTNSYEPISISDPPFPMSGPMFVPPSEWPKYLKPMRKSLLEVLNSTLINEVPVYDYAVLRHIHRPLAKVHLL